MNSNLNFNRLYLRYFKQLKCKLIYRVNNNNKRHISVMYMYVKGIDLTSTVINNNKITHFSKCFLIYMY